MINNEHEQLSLAVYSLKKVGFRYGMYAFVTGCDDFSYTIGALLLHCGAAGVTIGVNTPDEQKKAESLGFTPYTYGSNNGESAKTLTDGRLFDLVFATTGNASAYDAFIDMLKRGGVVAILARLDTPYTFFVKTAVRSQIRFIGVQSFDERSAEIAKDLAAKDWRARR